MATKDKTTTIKLHKSTVKQLKQLGKMGESYEDVILKLLMQNKKSKE